MAQGKIKDQKVIMIGGSAGSLDALLGIVPFLRHDLAHPIVLVLHRKSSGEHMLTDLLATRTTLKVMEAEEKEPLRRGVIYIAPGDYHLLFERDHTLSFDDSERVNYSRPSIDVSFQSAADVFGTSLICVLLSGANADGTEGFRYAKKKGGTLVAQLPASADVDYMPRHAIQNTNVDHVLDVAGIVAFLNGVV